MVFAPTWWSSASTTSEPSDGRLVHAVVAIRPRERTAAGVGARRVGIAVGHISCEVCAAADAAPTRRKDSSRVASGPRAAVQV